MAHVAITALGSVDQDPPMVSCEGWAESQSKVRTDLILMLARMRAYEVTYSLQELVGPDWYGRSSGPVYDHGGPLVVYLMEHYGPEKFLSLYHGVRQATFAADCERILGESWPTVEQDFWKWLPQEATRLASEKRSKKPRMEKTAKDVVLAKPVNERDWQAIVDGYRAAWPKRPQVHKSARLRSIVIGRIQPRHRTQRSSTNNHRDMLSTAIPFGKLSSSVRTDL
jgi:hypothetical protein